MVEVVVIQRYVAPLPEGVKEERYDATCDATIALMRYGGGLPWHRQAGLQAMGGMPLGDATMWERCEATADAAMGIFLSLMRLAVGGHLGFPDLWLPAPAEQVSWVVRRRMLEWRGSAFEPRQSFQPKSV